MQDDRDHRCLQGSSAFDGQIDRLGRFRIDPITKTAERPVSSQCGADSRSHRLGHLFHPTEGKGSGAMFGHGPIFRDLNVSVDPDAVGAILSLPVPITLIPNDAARETLITGADLDVLARKGAASEWVAQSARDWLSYWNNEVGLPGFYPFDWIAAAYLTDPGLFNCAAVTARMTREWTFWIMPHASLVVERRSAPSVKPGQDIQYCPETSALLHSFLVAP